MKTEGLSRRAWLKATTAAAAAVLAGASGAMAQGAAVDYPQRPVRIVVPYAPGGASDILARLIAPLYEQALGKPFVVDNRGGGGSTIGTQIVATAPPDGHTMGVIDSAFVINPGLFGAKLPYDTERQFAPVTLLATAPLALVVHGSVAAEDMRAFIALAKAKPGQLSFGSAGLGSAIHLAGEQLKQVAGIEVIHVPYRGGSASLADLLAGQIQFIFSTVPTIAEHVRSGRVRALGVTGGRVAQLPGVPSMAEAGLPGVDASPLFAVVAPAGTPPAILARLHEVPAGAIRSGPLRERLLEMGFLPVGNTPAELAAVFAAEIAKWRGVIRAGDIKPE